MSGFVGLMGTYPISQGEYRSAGRTVARTAYGPPPLGLPTRPSDAPPQRGLRASAGSRRPGAVGTQRASAAITASVSRTAGTSWSSQSTSQTSSGASQHNSS